MYSGRKTTVLLVEDHQGVRDCLLFMLETSGYDVIAAADGPDALQKVRGCKGRIDLLLSDIRMPKMSGIQLAQKVQLERPETRVLLMSGYAFESLPSAQGWRFLEKPITPQELREEIGAMLQESSMSRRA
jgi:two-component system cell cycle sensor histidine kinase/response regulator CckA